MEANSHKPRMDTKKPRMDPSMPVDFIRSQMDTNSYKPRMDAKGHEETTNGYVYAGGRASKRR
jgi:hypothetical protein